MINSIIKSCIDFIKFVLIVKIIFMQIFQCFGICRDQSFNHIIARRYWSKQIYLNCCIIKVLIPTLALILHLNKMYFLKHINHI